MSPVLLRDCYDYVTVSPLFNNVQIHKGDGLLLIPSPLLYLFRALIFFESNNRTPWDYRVLGNNHDPVTNIIIGPLRLLHASAIGYADLVADARVFVDNRLVNRRIGANANIGNALGGIAFEIRGRLIKIRAHYN